MTTQQCISVTDLDGNYLYLNDTLSETLGYSSEALAQLGSQQIIAEALPAKINHEITQTLAQGYSWQGVIPTKHQNGDVIWLDSFITPRYENGKIVGHQTISEVATLKLQRNAKRVYQNIDKGNAWANFESSKNHRFALLVLLSLICQFFIFTYLGIYSSIVAAFSALAPIIVFWRDIIPTGLHAQSLQSNFDSISRRVYYGAGSDSVFRFNFLMIKTKLKAILERTLDASKPIGKVMNTVEQGVGATKDALEQQKCDVEQLSTAMLQMNTSTQEIAANTVTAASELDSIYNQCAQAQQAINSTTDNIKHLATEVEEASASADQLTEAANNVGGLMEEIQSIADQTNLLALNAAIEAARAGEHGRGFAVVAEEVRNLSSRTQDSAEEIHQRLSAMQNTINQWVKLMEKNREDAEVCVEAAEGSHDKIAQIVNNVEEISSVAGQIATAAEEQSCVSEEINNSLHDVQQRIDHTWQQTDLVNEQMATLQQSVDDIANIASTFIPPNKK